VDAFVSGFILKFIRASSGVLRLRSEFERVKKTLVQLKINHQELKEKDATMRTLVVEDDFTSRLLLQKLLAPYGEIHVAANGKEALEAFRAARKEKCAYDLICLDIMMPEMNGQSALKEMRMIEEGEGIPVGRGAKILMTTALKDPKNVMTAFLEMCDGYLVKPIEKGKLLEHLKELGLLRNNLVS
jgi:two-component system, chemotaxis family, chemotaxis protein CheY